MTLLTMYDTHRGTISNIAEFVSHYFDCITKFVINTFS